MRIFRQLVFMSIALAHWGCSTHSELDYTFIEIPETINSDPEKLLTAEQLKYDKRQIKYSLNNVYSGRMFLPGEEHEQLLENIDRIQGETSARDFCAKVAQAFEAVSDNHLSAMFNDKDCARSKVNRKGEVGDNYYRGKTVPWDVRLKAKDGTNALLVSITSFHKRSSPVWDGFIDRVEKLLPDARLVILDMRGNGGGDDSIGYELSSMLAGNQLETPYTKQWTSANPESFQILVNTFEYWRRERLEQGEDVPRYVDELKDIFEDKRERAKNGEIVPIADDEDNDQSEQEKDDFDLNKSIKKPIYILVDADCASSCESTTDFFEFNPLATTVGENTAGYVHFGNNGSVFLWNSGVRLQMAVSYNGYYDGRFIEKVGITPEVKVPAGQDAMGFAWNDYFEKAVDNGL